MSLNVRVVRARVVCVKCIDHMYMYNMLCTVSACVYHVHVHSTCLCVLCHMCACVACGVCTQYVHV